MYIYIYIYICILIPVGSQNTPFLEGNRAMNLSSGLPWQGLLLLKLSTTRATSLAAVRLLGMSFRTVHSHCSYFPQKCAFQEKSFETMRQNSTSGVHCNRSLQTASCPGLADTIHPTIPTHNQYIVQNTHTHQSVR